MGEKQVTGKISLVDAMSAPLRQMTQHMEQTARAARELDTALRFQGTNVVPLHQATQSTSQLDHNVVQLTNHLHQSAQGTTQFGNNLHHLNTDLSQSTQHVNQLEHEMQQLRHEFQQSAQQVNQLEHNLQLMDRDLQLSAQRVNHLETQVEQLTREMQQATQQINQLNTALNQNSNSTQQAANRMAALRERFGGVSERQATMLQGLERASGALFSTGAAATIAGGAVAMGMGSAVKTAADFEQQMAKVGAISGATGGQLSSLTETAKELGASTTKSASEVAIGMQNLAASGFEVNDIISAMPGIIAASEAAQEDMAMTSETVAAALNAFGLEAKESSHIADVLSQSANQSAAGILDMQYSFKYAAPVAKMLGISLEELSAATGIMADSGIKGEQAGTSLRAALLRLADPPKSASKALSALGISITDSNGKMKPFHDIIGQVGNATKDMGNAQKAAALSNIFGTEAVSGMLAVIEAGPDKLQKLTKGLKDSGGAAAETAKKMQDNLNGSLNQLSGSFETLQISVGNALIPMIRLIADGLGMLTDAFNALPGPVQTVLTVMLALVGVTLLIGGPLMILLGFLPGIVEGFALLAGAMGMTSGALLGVAGTALTVIGVIAAIAIGIALLWSYSETFRSIVYAAIDGVKSAFDSLMMKITQVKNFLVTTWSGIKAIFSGNEGKGVSILGSLGFGPETIKTVMTISTNIKLAISSIKALVAGNDTQAGGFLRTLGFSEGAIGVIFSVKNALSSVMNTVKGFSTLLGGNEGKAVSLLSRAGLDPETIRQSIGVINNVKNAVKGLFDIFKGNTQQGVSFLKMAGLSPDMIGQITSTVSSVKQAFSGIVSVVKSVASQIASAFKGSGPVIMSSLSTIVKSIITIFRTLQPVLSVVFSVIKIIVVGALQNLAGFIKGVTGVILAVVKIFSSLLTGNWRGLWEGIKSLFTNALMAIWNGVQLLFLGRLFGVFKAGFTALKAIFTGGWAAIRNGFMTGLSAVWNGAKSIFTKSITGLGNALSTGFKFMFNGAVTIVRGYINILQSIINFGFNFIRNIITTILQVVLNIFRASWSGIVQVVSSAVSALRSAISAGLNAAGAFIRSIWSSVSSFTSSTWSAMRTGVSNALSGMLNAVKTILGNIKSFFQSTWQSILNTVKELPGKFLAYGKAIINGLWDGIKSAAVGLGDKVSGLIDSIVPGPVKKLLGINSPSKLFRQYGIWTIQGLEGGMEERQDKARQSAVNIAKEVTVPFAHNGNGKSYTSSSVTNSQKSSSVKNEFNVTISADTARAMNEDDATFKELADKFLNYVADKMDDVSNARTDVNLGVMEQ
ncbi:phage tail tape measure protein [Bacillus pacificus]|uniref:phage tail tape measure protein n=1 Tax=Bacillus pacificus TaxID=2026187 RepID=UPI003EE31621